MITQKSYGPVYVQCKVDKQNILMPQETDMSRKGN